MLSSLLAIDQGIRRAFAAGILFIAGRFCAWLSPETISIIRKERDAKTEADKH